ncbi:MAG: (2Fe-2S)-binding protein, partial [Pseudomonadales bacterium]|nr:(2Fe-2S)-binding protein [Pseudomonadales bacterium]
MNKLAVNLQVNGRDYDLSVASNKTLLEVLRDQLDLPDTKYGCGTGECGACTVLIDGQVVNSCLTLAAAVDGKSITTAIGLEKDGELHPVQEAFVEETAVQCGYCIPGMVVKTVGLLEKNPDPSEAEIRHWLEGNICRCTGYEKIVAAVK